MSEIDVDNILSEFKLKLTDQYPRDSKLYLYADYFEFVALVSHDEIGVVEMKDRLKDEDIIGRNKTGDGDNNTVSSNNSLINDDDETFVINILTLIKQRSSVFCDLYPFHLVGDEYFAINEELTDNQKLYIFLLVASNLHLFKGCIGNITTEFELVSEKALRTYLPDFAKVRGFGKNSVYKGYAIDKIIALAKDMKLDVNDKVLSSISGKSTQEMGLDIVAWLPFKDSIGNQISIFAQCACGKDWISKISESSRYNNLIHPYLSNFSHAFFVPYSLGKYNSSNSFFDDCYFGVSVLVFERFRILSLLQNKSIIDDLESKSLIERVIEYNEDIV